jgi:hypothetical protein
MQSYSHFFQTLHDETVPTGHLGSGTHASILRAIVFHGPTFVSLRTGAYADLAIIWDEDHDIRVIKAIEAIYRAGFLGSILMIGERKGTLNAIVSDHVQDLKVLNSLEEKLRVVAQKMDGDPWSSSLRKIDGPNHEIIDDLDHKVALYLANLKMLWRLGVKVSAQDRTKQSLDLTQEQILAIVRSIPGDNKKAEETRVLLIRSLADQIAAEKQQIDPKTTEHDSDNVARKFRPEFPDLTDEQILAIVKSIPGEGEDAEKTRIRLLLNLEKQIKAEKEGTPFRLTAWTSVEAETKEDRQPKAEDHSVGPAPKFRLVEN